MRLWLLGWSLAGVVSASAPVHTGLKIVVLESSRGGTLETTEYVAEDRARTELRLSSALPGGDVQRHVHIRRCDLGKILFLNEAERTYTAAPASTQLNVVERAALSIARPHAPQPGTPEIIVETTTVDTGERNRVFGYTARRVVTTQRQMSVGFPGGTQETVTDGWYIDLDTRVSCEREEGPGGRRVLIATSGTDPRTNVPPRVTFKDVGAVEDGFPIDTRTTSRVVGANGGEDPPAFVTHRRVPDLRRQALDASLFEVPPGFRSADGIFGGVTTRWQRTATIVRSVVASWFR